MKSIPIGLGLRCWFFRVGFNIDIKPFPHFKLVQGDLSQILLIPYQRSDFSHANDVSSIYHAVKMRSIINKFPVSLLSLTYQVRYGSYSVKVNVLVYVPNNVPIRYISLT